MSRTKAKQGAGQDTEVLEPTASRVFKATAILHGESPYSQSAVITSKPEEQETADAHERRVWRERMHKDEAGLLFAPPLAIKNALSEAARFLGKRIPGKGLKTYREVFESGIACMDPIPVYASEDAFRRQERLSAEGVSGESYFVPSDGRRGGGRRVWKTFPVVPAGWVMVAVAYVLHGNITRDVFYQHLVAAGIVADYLRTVPIGTVVPYDDLRRLLAGGDPQSGMRHIVASARNLLLRERIIFGTVTNVGLKRLGDAGALDATESHLDRSTRAVRRAASTLRAANPEALSQTERLRYDRNVLRVGVLRQFGGQKARKRLDSIAQAGRRLGDLRRHLLGTLRALIDQRLAADEGTLFDMGRK